MVYLNFTQMATDNFLCLYLSCVSDFTLWSLHLSFVFVFISCLFLYFHVSLGSVPSFDQWEFPTVRYLTPMVHVPVQLSFATPCIALWISPTGWCMNEEITHRKSGIRWTGLSNEEHSTCWVLSVFIIDSWVGKLCYIQMNKDVGLLYKAEKGCRYIQCFILYTSDAADE